MKTKCKCPFCEEHKYVEQNFPDEGYNHMDSAGYVLLHNNYLHISPQYMSPGAKRHFPIFNFKIRFCPFCGRQLDYSNDNEEYDI